MKRRSAPLAACIAASCAIAIAGAGAAGSTRFSVTGPASSLVGQGLAAAAPANADGFQDVPAPGIRFVPNEAQATTAPWIDSNGWRFQRGLKKAAYTKLPAGSAPLAAAEAFAFDAEAIINADAADVEELGKMLRFLKAQERPALPAMANVASWTMARRSSGRS